MTGMNAINTPMLDIASETAEIEAWVASKNCIDGLGGNHSIFQPQKSMSYRPSHEAITQEESEYPLESSNGNYKSIDPFLTEITTITEANQESYDCGSLPKEREYLRNEDRLALEPSRIDSAADSLNATTSVLDSTLSSALEAFTIETQPAIDAGEIKRFMKRSHALLELETTEKSYVDDLDVLLHVYLQALESKSWFPQLILAKMRRCVSGLLVMHRGLHARLKTSKIYESDRDHQAPLIVYKNLAEAFSLMNHGNSLYGIFAELRMRTINEISRSGGQATMALLQKESKELMALQHRPSSRTDLKDFLIKPIQRICRYPLLLKEILRLTNENDPEHEYISRAYQFMRGKAREMDETQRAVERKLLTEQILRKFPDSSFPKKIGPSTKERLVAGIGALNEVQNGHSSQSNENEHGSGDGNGNVICSYNSGASIHPCYLCSADDMHCGNSRAAPKHVPRSSPEGLSDFSPSCEDVAPTVLTKAFAATLGSIVLAGALEYVITPDIPIRLKYYGCFLFNTMLVIVKAKKTSLYEPRQWLPLRLCELHETTQLDGM
ncbi:Dbl homology domain-containing protein [Lobosporangium transversale]|uniref:Dbl homology domain-containing protein n=1 Tax=Lobosporangium transversale TaxID=64571 RepID=A0A1Y2GFT3_9FUNG|nr:Dbl homology domain-containing protein [Lobosporangium transversale]ORZ09667.1 Dbl homology domain-containing protein [Lobosporangium transversale]|eukprot:XP_021878937.1 Dbl homology domain-containing protein [Lobosporangium transversale]